MMKRVLMNYVLCWTWKKLLMTCKAIFSFYLAFLSKELNLCHPFFRDSSKVCTSYDAGHYLCDFVFFKSLYASKGRSLFIHVPPLEKPFKAEELAEIIAKVLKRIVDEVM